MKKLLLSIFGIFFGLIGFSSAESFDFNLNNSVNLFDSNFQLIGSFRLINYGSTFSIRPASFDISFIGFSDSLFLNSITLPGSDNYRNKLVCGDFSFDLVSYSDGLVFDTSGIDLSLYGYSLHNCHLLRFGSDYGVTSVEVSPSSISNSIYGNYIDLGISDFSGFVVFSGYKDGSYLGVPVKFSFDYSISSDSFTVNYGDQSKKYIITDDLDIFINSPVVKNGNTFTFDGSTGINLFFNNSSDWYNKDKLYLGGNYSFSKGVFNPVCM